MAAERNESDLGHEVPGTMEIQSDESPLAILLSQARSSSRGSTAEEALISLVKVADKLTDIIQTMKSLDAVYDDVQEAWRALNAVNRRIKLIADYNNIVPPPGA